MHIKCSWIVDYVGRRLLRCCVTAGQRLLPIVHAAFSGHRRVVHLASGCRERFGIRYESSSSEKCRSSPSSDSSLSRNRQSQPASPARWRKPSPLRNSTRDADLAVFATAYPSSVGSADRVLVDRICSSCPWHPQVSLGVVPNADNPPAKHAATTCLMLPPFGRQHKLGGTPRGD